MDALLSKIDHLNYEIFAVFLPGAFATVGVLAFWYSLGNIVPWLTLGVLQELTLLRLVEYRENIQSLAGWPGVVFTLTGTSYMLGHWLDQVYRMFNSTVPSKKVRADAGQPRDTVDNTQRAAATHAADSKARVRTVWLAAAAQVRLWVWDLTFQPVKSRTPDNYNPKLKPLLRAAAQKLAISGAEDTSWDAFFPVARKCVWDHKGHSLITMYELKYTLHRSLATLSALLAWAAGFSGVLALVCRHTADRPILLFSVASFGAVSTIRFSQSYRANWFYFGNAIVTEAYAVLVVRPESEEPRT